ncbi:MAG TPA: 2,3-diaminopropionate biosynthesis protein SbnA [Pyrinomonadaceae bacterium]
METANEGVLSAIGNTPLVRLSKVFTDLEFNLYAKLEMLNPGGSIKDRTAVSILEQGMKAGLINRDTIIIESSSGNMGVGLAQACSFYGLKFICVVDAKTTAQNTRILRAYGAEIVQINEPDPETGEFLKARIDHVESLLKSIPNSFWPNQYTSVYNPLAHHRTMNEIRAVLGDRLDYLFCATSTFGTLRGCAEYVRKHKLSTKVVAVDAVGSVIFGGQKSKRLIPGHGAAITPPLFKADLADHVVHVTDVDCVVGCRRLARREAILAGGSSGAVVMAVDKMRHVIPRGANCGVILPDRGERYLDTIYANQWVEEHFKDISHHWMEDRDEECVVAA